MNWQLPHRSGRQPVLARNVVATSQPLAGFFGACGMGWFLPESVQRIASNDVAAILLSIILVVIVSEPLSAWLRTRIARAIA